MDTLREKIGDLDVDQSPLSKPGPEKDGGRAAREAHRGTLRDKNLLSLISVVVARAYLFGQSHQTEHFKWVHLSVCLLSLKP